MRSKQACGFLAAALLTLTMAFGRAPAAEKVAGDRLLPPDVYLYVEVPSVPELKARMSKTLTGQLVGEPALADFWKDVEAQIDKLSEQVEGQVGVGLKSLLSIPSGQVTIAVERASTGEVGLVAILDYGENTSTVDKLLATANEKLQEHGAEKSETDVDGTKVVVHTITEKKEEGDQGGGTDKPETHSVAWFNRDNHLVVASGIEHAKSVLARWDGKHSSTFADNETHKYIRTRCKTSNSEPGINWFVNPVALIQAAVETAAKENLQAQMALTFLPRLGLSELKAIGGSLDMNAGEFDTVSRTMVYVDGETHGLLSILHFPEAELSPPKWVTTSASSYVTYNWDVLGAYSAIEELVDGIQGPGTLATLIEQLAQQPGGPQIHLKKDFLDHLTGRVHMVGAAPKEEAKEGAAEGEAPVGRVMFAFDAKNADKLKSALDSVAKLPDFGAKTREVSGTTVYEFRTGVGPQSAAAIVDNALMFATDVAMIEAVIRGDSDQQPLSESPDYRKVASHFPTKASAIGYEKQDAEVETVYEMMRSGKSPLMPIPSLDFSKLPPFSDIKKYLSPTGSFAIPDQHGAYYETFTLPKSSN